MLLYFLDALKLCMAVGHIFFSSQILHRFHSLCRNFGSFNLNVRLFVGTILEIFWKVFCIILCNLEMHLLAWLNSPSYDLNLKIVFCLCIVFNKLPEKSTFSVAINNLTLKGEVRQHKLHKVY